MSVIKMKKSFTLIELLVVIAIIGILVTLLLPSLRKARDEAHSVVCKSNLKQIGTGVYLYAKNNAGYMPTSNIGNSGHYTPGLVYYTSPYMSVELDHADYYQTDLRNTAFDEPVLNGPEKGGIDYPSASGYGWNWRYMGYKQKKHSKVYWPQLLEGISDTSESMLAGDTSDKKNLWGHLYFRYQNVGDRHRNRINALHGDGHVEPVMSSSIGTNANSKWWYSDSSH
jgi:prepilin-type N-terminal cleavage/methylation domain-containing protein/prepilin-type processing-associated H-X9-DG protein